MIRLLAIIIIAGLTTASLSYVKTTNPEALDELLVHIDVLGITKVASIERERINMIRNLDIPFEQKKVLMERTIFMGASRQMVVLALGQPKGATRLSGKPSPQNPELKPTERWVYYFKGDQRPTVLDFEKDTLVSAYKGSAIDVK